MASAFLDGNLSIKDYTDIKNKQADTIMRQSFAKYDGVGEQLKKEDIIGDSPLQDSESSDNSAE